MRFYAEEEPRKHSLRTRKEIDYREKSTSSSDIDIDDNDGEEDMDNMREDSDVCDAETASFHEVSVWKAEFDSDNLVVGEN